MVRLLCFVALFLITSSSLAVVDDDNKVWTTRNEVSCGRSESPPLADKGRMFTDITHQAGIDH